MPLSMPDFPSDLVSATGVRSRNRGDRVAARTAGPTAHYPYIMSQNVSADDTTAGDAGNHVDRTAEWDRLRTTYQQPADSRPPSSAQGLHHMALLSSDVTTTIEFYQGILEFPLTDLFENRDYPGSTHFFFDIGNGNGLAFFDFPGLDLGPYAEVLGGLHHIAISVSEDKWHHLRNKLEQAGVEIVFEDRSSIYFMGPDGERLELIADPLGEMYGSRVL